MTLTQTSDTDGEQTRDHVNSGFGMLDMSIVRACDPSVRYFSYIVLVGIIGSALMRVVVFKEILEFLDFNPKFLLATLAAVTLIGLSLDHTFFRSSLERVSSRSVLTTGHHVRSMLPMFATGLLLPFLVRISLLAPTLVLMLVIMLKASIGPIQATIASWENERNAGLVIQIETDLNTEEIALRSDVTGAEARITAAQTAWERENALAERMVNSHLQEIAEMQVQSTALQAALVDLEQEKSDQERIMYCEQNHSSDRPIRGCEDASGTRGEGQNFLKAERTAGVLASQIAVRQTQMANNAKAQQEITTRIDAVRLTPLNTAKQEQQLRLARERLTNFVQGRAEEARKRFGAAGPVTLDPNSLALQLSALSHVWSEGGVVLPLALIASMFAVFDLAFALIALSFAPREYIAKLAEKMLGYEARTDRVTHDTVSGRSNYVNEAIEAGLDVEIQAKIRAPSFVREQAKKRRADMAEQRQFSSTLRQQFFKEVAVAANSNDPRHRR